MSSGGRSGHGDDLFLRQGFALFNNHVDVVCTNVGGYTSMVSGIVYIMGTLFAGVRWV